MYSGIEMMIVQAARQIKRGETVFAGVGFPIMAMAVAKKFYQPDITILCESGIVDTMPKRLALSIADYSLASNCSGIFTPYEIFSFFLQGGHIDVGVLGGAQMDRYGNINSTVIGAYDAPKVRMPGSGGACEIAINAKSILAIMPQGKRRFVESVDFVTSPGHVTDPSIAGCIPGGGPRAVVSDLGRYEFSSDTREMFLSGLYGNSSIQAVRDNTTWDILIKDEPELLTPPSEDELAYIRALDPQGIFLGKSA